MSERKKSNNKMIKRILSGVMAFAIALSMCMVAMPTRVLADDIRDFWVFEDGSIDTTLTGHDENKMQMFGENLSVAPTTSVLVYSSNTLTFKSAVSLDALGIAKNG
jgi:hypothetical protein